MARSSHLPGLSLSTYRLPSVSSSAVRKAVTSSFSTAPRSTFTWVLVDSTTCSPSFSSFAGNATLHHATFARRPAHVEENAPTALDLLHPPGKAPHVTATTDQNHEPATNT